MRVAILTTVHAALDGRIFYKEAVSLAEAGHEVTLFAPYNLEAHQVAERWGITYIPLHKLSGRMARPLQWLYLLQLLQKFSFDVWHFHDPELLFLTIFGKWLLFRRANLIYDVHEDVPRDILTKPWIPNNFRKPIAYIFERLENWGAQHCQVVITATDAIGRRMEQAAKNVVVVRNYPIIPTSEVQSHTTRARNDNTVRVIYCGNLTEPRGIREIVQAMDELTDYNIKLTLLGYLYPAQFDQEIRQHAGPNVEILGRVPFEDVPSYLQASDIGIVCLHPLPSFLESLPVKLFEYMQANLPVIASDFPLWRQIIEDAGCGVLVDPTNPTQIAQAIYNLANDPILRQAMGEAGAKAIGEKYSWKCESYTLQQAYQML